VLLYSSVDRYNISEELGAFFSEEKKIIYSTLKIEEADSIETLVAICQTTGFQPSF
jgi:hypothetical protein